MMQDDGVIARFGTYEVDLDRLEIRADGIVVPVEPQVFDVVSYLIERRDELVTKEELLDNVWGDRFVSESALTSRIKSARQALGDNGRDQAVIKTAHGRGYRFVAEVVLVDQRAEPAASDPPTLAAAPADTDAPELDGDWPLVGRHDELDELERHVEDPDRTGILLTGPAGIGKTRLARVCLDRAREAGLPTAQVSGHAESAQIPLASFSHLLPADVLEASATSADLERAVVFQRARAALHDLAGGRRLVLMVDNADHVDELSTALLGSLVAADSVFAVMTQRTAPGETLMLEELVRSNQVAHLDLAPLDDTDLDVLLYRVLAGPIDLSSLQHLTALSRGRPGALQQLVETCRATNALDRQAGVWRLVGPIQPTAGRPGADRLPIDQLDPAAAAGAELIAVAEDLDLDLATQILGADVLDALDRHGLLALSESSGAPRVSLAQAHVGLLLEENLGPLRARRHKHRLIAAMADVDLTAADRVRRVRWTIETGADPDLTELLDATRSAVANADGVIADVLLDHLDRSHPGPEALQLRAELSFRRGQVQQADRLLGEIDVDALDPVSAATVLRRRATIRFHVHAEFAAAVHQLESAAGEFDGDARVLLDAHWIGLQGFLGSSDAILARRAAMPDELDGSPALEVLRGLAQAHAAAGRFGEALAVLDEHDRGLREVSPGAAQAGFEVATATRVAVHVAAGTIRQSSELIHRQLPIGRRTMLAWLPMAAARSEMMAGHPRTARELISTPLAAVRSQNLIHAEPQMLGILAQTTVRLDDPDLARRQALEAEERVDTLEGQLRWALLLSIADVFVHLGPRDDLNRRLIDEASAASARGARLFEAELLMAAARSGAARSVCDRLGSLADEIEGDFWAIRARHAAALADEDLGEVDAIETSYRGLGYEGIADGLARAKGRR